MKAKTNEATTHTAQLPVGGSGGTSAGNSIDGGEEFAICNILTGASGAAASLSTFTSPAISMSSDNVPTSCGATLTGADRDDGGGAYEYEPVASADGDGNSDRDSIPSSQGGHGLVAAAADDDQDDDSQILSVGNEEESGQHAGFGLGDEPFHAKIQSRAGTTVDCGRIDLMELARGPVLALAALWSLTLPYVLEATASVSLSSLLALAVFTAGFLLTIRDFDRFFHRQLRRVLRALVVWADGLVLDHVLRDCIMTAHGCVGVAASAVGLYSLPLTTEERMEAIDAAVLQFGGDGFIGATEILAEPGGVLRLLPPEWMNKIRSTSGFSHEDQVGTNTSSELHAPLHGLEEDLTLEGTDWEEGRESGNIAASASSDTVETDVGSDENENETSDSRVRGDDNDPNGSFPATCNGPLSTEAHTLFRIRSQHREQRSPRVPCNARRTDRRTLTQLAIERIQGALLEASPVFFSDDRSLRRIGTAASVAFLVHARSSRTARRVLWGAAHGAASLSLAGLAVGSVAALATKRVLLPQPPLPARAPCLSQGQGGQSAPPHDVSGSDQVGGEEKGDGSDLECSHGRRRRFAQNLIDWVKSIVEGADPRIRRAQGIIVVAIMFYIAKRQRRQQRNLATSRV